MNPLLQTWPHFHRPATVPDAPVLLLLHGTGGTERDLIGLADRIAPGAALLAPRGRVSEHGANRYFARLAEGVFDSAEVAARTRELADFITIAAEHYRLPALTAVGFSNGANVVATLLQLAPATPLAAAILLRPMVVLDQAAAPDSLAGRRILLLNGDKDPIVPLDHPPRLAALLQAGGAHVETRLLTAGHGLIADDIAAATAFFTR